MEEKTIKNFQESIEKEIKSLESCILNGVWNKDNQQSLLNNIELLQKYKATLLHIKFFQRGLI